MEAHEQALADRLAAEARDELPRLIADAQAAIAACDNREEAMSRIAAALLYNDPRGVAMLAAASLVALAEQS